MSRYRVFLILFALLAAACAGSAELNAAPESEAAEKLAPARGIPAAAQDGDKGVAVFAGGCFW